MHVFGTGVLQAVVLIAALQIAFAPIQAYRAWPTGRADPARHAGVEAVLIVDHGRFGRPRVRRPTTTDDAARGRLGRPGPRACS